MSYRAILELLFPDRPFFATAMTGAQTMVVHHLTMMALVAMTAERGRPVRVLEVGSWLGFSALTWCHAVARFSPPGGSVMCIDSWAPYFKEADIGKGAGNYAGMDRMSRLGLSYDLFLHNMSFRAKGVEWSHKRGDSAEIMAGLAPGSFDIIYLDASHYYEHVKRDIQQAERLLADGGIICGDDLSIQLHELDESLVRAKLDEDCYVDPATNAFFHPGVTLAVGERFGPVSEWACLWAVRNSGPGRFERFAPSKVPTSVPDHFNEEQRRDAERLLGLKPA